MRILGIDPALTVTGYGVIDFVKNKYFVLEAGVIKTSGSELVQQRLKKIYEGITALISEVKPDTMVLEKLYAHYHHPTTAYILGQARGVICLVSAEADIPLVEYSATRVKKAIAGQGLASKQQIQRMVVNLLNLRQLPKYTDVTDALALAIAYGNTIRLHHRGISLV